MDRQGILITGGTGFIGGALARDLLARGERVTILARRPDRAAPLAALGATVEPGDLLDPPSLARAAAGRRTIVHCAGLPRPATLREFRRVHVEGTRLLLEAARAAGVPRWIQLSSVAAVFGGGDLEGDESLPRPQRFIDPYSETKARAEELVLAAHGAELETTALRPGVVWGPGDTTVLPILARLSRTIGVPRAGDGRNRESTTYIGNLLAGVRAALAAPRLEGKAYFILDGFEIGWREFIARQLGTCGIRARFLPVLPLLAEPAALLLDRAAGLLGFRVPLACFGLRMARTSRRLTSRRAGVELGYRPEVSLEEGLLELGRWWREVGSRRSEVGSRK